MDRNKRRSFRLVAFAIAFLLAHYAIAFLATIPAGTLLPEWGQRYLPLAARLAIAVFSILIILLAGNIIERFIRAKSETEGVQYNLLRVNRLFVTLFAAIVTVSFLFQNLYAAAVSFGLISLILGFALQVPISSFIAWLYIIFRGTYHIGDRIQIGELRGDVLEISYLDTTVAECSGDYLGNDQPSGRLIRFPNSVVLKDKVINYSGPEAPFIWNETALQIAWTSDLAFVEACLAEAADADFAESHPGQPFTPDRAARVYFRNNAFAWLEAVVSYPVGPRDTTGRRNRILRRALPALNRAPEKVQFPEGARR